MVNCIKRLANSAFLLIMKDKTKGNKIGYTFNLLGIVSVPMLFIILVWYMLEMLVYGEIVYRAIDDIIAFLVMAVMYGILRLGIYIGQSMELKKRTLNKSIETN